MNFKIIIVATGTSQVMKLKCPECNLTAAILLGGPFSNVLVRYFRYKHNQFHNQQISIKEKRTI